MTLPSRRRIRNSNPKGLRPSRLPLGHGGSPQCFKSFTSGWRGNIFISFKPGDRQRNLNSSVKGSGANHHPRAPARLLTKRVKHL